MSSESAASRAMETIDVENVSFTDENLTWTSTGVSKSTPRHELVLVREVKSSTVLPSHYLIFLLKEDQDNKENPYCLSVLKAKQIPSELRIITLAELPLIWSTVMPTYMASRTKWMLLSQ
ncbi:hypothetical protein NXS19_013482 [Fusarium pseudograminearum]|nr:hypothetical protein NXS19_013482 [Fusarium pseudograminearum]